MMAFLWTGIEAIVPGKAGLFLIFGAVYGICAFGLALCAIRISVTTSILVTAVVIFPGLLTQGAMLFKDFLMAVVLACAAVAGLQVFRTTEIRRYLWLFVAAAVAVIGLLLRTNAVFAVSPIIAGLLLRKKPLGLRRLVLSSVLLSVVLIPISALVNDVAFRPLKMSVANSLFIFDFAGITHFSGVNVFPAEVSQVYTIQDNATCYSPQWWDPFIDWRDFHAERFGKTEPLRVAFVADSRFAACQAVWRIMRQANLEQGRTFLGDWLLALAQHPVSYLGHRISHSNETLEFLVPVSRSISRASEQVNPFGWTFALNPLSTAIITLANFFGSTPLCWPFFWLLVGIVTLFNARSLHDESTRRLVMSLSLSGTLYTAGLLVVGVAYGYRYHAWLFLSCGASAALLIGSAARDRSLRPLAFHYAISVVPLVTLAALWRYFKLPAPYLL